MSLATMLAIIVSASLVTSMRTQQTVDLESVLRAAYHESGAVTESKAALLGLEEPVSFLSVGDRNASSLLVVLLHGMAFTASTWKFVGTLDALANAGIPAVALDLHGYGGQYASASVRKSLLRQFLQAIGWSHPVVVVAASMGGTVGAPFVLQAPHVQAVAGYVSVSALLSGVGVSHSNVPALLVWGDQDSPNSNKAIAHENMFTTHQKVVLPDAPHPCYLKWPKAFNALLVAFAAGPQASVTQADQALLAEAGVPALKVHAAGGFWERSWSCRQGEPGAMIDSRAYIPRAHIGAQGRPGAVSSPARIGYRHFLVVGIRNK
jgi:pimeloyl-ACP methyl ester carboxylesterase